MQGKSRKTFTVTLSTKSVFCKFQFVCRRRPPPPHVRAPSKLHFNVIPPSSMQPISGFPTAIHRHFSFIPCMLHDRTNSNLHYPILFSVFALRYCLPVSSRRPTRPVLPAPSVYNLVQCVTFCWFFFDRFENTPLKHDHCHHHSSLLWPSFWRLEFGGVVYIFGKFVEPKYQRLN
jgi:hypothetical protein